MFLIYSLVWSFTNATEHEACHGTPFRNQKLNDTLLYVSSWMENWEPVAVRWVHAQHHTCTSIVGDDAEYVLPNAITWFDLLNLATGWIQVWHYNKELVQLTFGYTNHFVEVSVPDSEKLKVFRNARIFLCSYLIIVGASICFQSWMPVCLLLLPRAIGEPMHRILRITQHGGLATEAKDHRKTIRTMYVNPVL